MVLHCYLVTPFRLLRTYIIPLQPHWPPPWPSNLPAVFLPPGSCTSCSFGLECSTSEISRAHSLPKSGLYLNIVLSVRLLWTFCLSCISISLPLTPFPVIFFSLPSSKYCIFYLPALFVVCLIHPLNVNSMRTGFFFRSVHYSVLRTEPGTS